MRRCRECNATFVLQTDKQQSEMINNDASRNNAHEKKEREKDILCEHVAKMLTKGRLI
jgi:hypothetical protein